MIMIMIIIDNYKNKHIYGTYFSGVFVSSTLEIIV